MKILIRLFAAAATAAALGAFAETPRPADRAASQATAPTSPTTRALDITRPGGDAAAPGPAVAQVAIALRRGEPDRATALKPGRKTERRNGTVDEQEARCLAERDSAYRARCPDDSSRR